MASTSASTSPLAPKSVGEPTIITGEITGHDELQPKRIPKSFGIYNIHTGAEGKMMIGDGDYSVRSEVITKITEYSTVSGSTTADGEVFI